MKAKLLLAVPAAAAFVAAIGFTRPAISAPIAALVAAGISNYCTPGTSVIGCVATMTSTGVPSVTSPNGFVVSAVQVPGMKNGILRYSLAPNATPWCFGGSSVLCIKAPMQNTGVKNAGGTAGLCDGMLSLDILSYWSANTGKLGQPLSAGTTIYVQAAYSDFPSCKGISMSDGLEFTLAP